MVVFRRILLNADWFVRFRNSITNTKCSLLDIFTRKHTCDGCWRPLPDKTLKGDLVESPYIVVYPEQDLYGRINKNFANVVAGSNNGCRNCTVVLDALSSIFKSKNQTKFDFAIVIQKQTRTLTIECRLNKDSWVGRYIEPLQPTHMEVFRQSGMSD